jgi:hypothetical protein
MDWIYAISTVGLALELIGLVWTAVVLIVTWRTVADGHGFFGKRPSRVHPLSGTVAMHSGSTAYTHGTNTGFSTEKRLEMLESEVARLGAEAKKAEDAIKQEAKEREALRAGLSSLIDAKQAEEQERQRESERWGIRAASFGLLLAAIGTLLQFAAMTFPIEVLAG